MAISLDQILNFIIPIGVWIFLAYILYKPFATPINALINKIRDWREGRQASDESWGYETIKSIEYE
jgi:hypothetical protein